MYDIDSGKRAAVDCGAAVALDDVPNWCTLIPDYETNRLHIRLNYPGSAIFFSDPLCTLGSVLGFTSDLNTTSETLKMLETESIGLDILWRTGLTDDKGDALDYSQFSITIPALASGYTAASLVTKINELVHDHLYMNEGIFQTSPWDAMIASLEVTASGISAGEFHVKLTYTNANLVRIRGSMETSEVDTSGLSRGQLRAGLSATSAMVNPEFHSAVSMGNPYATESMRQPPVKKQRVRYGLNPAEDRFQEVCFLHAVFMDDDIFGYHGVERPDGPLHRPHDDDV